MMLTPRTYRYGQPAVLWIKHVQYKKKFWIIWYGGLTWGKLQNSLQHMDLATDFSVLWAILPGLTIL